MAIDQHFQNMFDAAAYNTAAWNDSGVVGSGIRLENGVRQFGLLVAVDDNGTALANNWYSAIFGQALIGAQPAGAGRNVSMFGVAGELHCPLSIINGGNLAGVFAYAELAAGYTISNNGDAVLCSLLCGLDIPSTAVVDTNSLAASIAVGGNLGGTHTGKVAVLTVMNPSAGDFDFLVNIGNGYSSDTTGLVTAATGVSTISKCVKWCVAGTTYYMPLCTGTS